MLKFVLICAVAFVCVTARPESSSSCGDAQTIQCLTRLWDNWNAEMDAARAKKDKKAVAAARKGRDEVQSALKRARDALSAPKALVRDPNEEQRKLDAIKHQKAKNREQREALQARADAETKAKQEEADAHKAVVDARKQFVNRVREEVKKTLIKVNHAWGGVRSACAAFDAEVRALHTEQAKNVYHRHDPAAFERAQKEKDQRVGEAEAAVHAARAPVHDAAQKVVALAKDACSFNVGMLEDSINSGKTEDICRNDAVKPSFAKNAQHLPLFADQQKCRDLYTPSAGVTYDQCCVASFAASDKVSKHHVHAHHVTTTV